MPQEGSGTQCWSVPSVFPCLLSKSDSPDENVETWIRAQNVQRWLSFQKIRRRVVRGNNLFERLERLFLFSEAEVDQSEIIWRDVGLPGTRKFRKVVRDFARFAHLPR
jgi:hypothetical protein